MSDALVERMSDGQWRAVFELGLFKTKDAACDAVAEIAEERGMGSVHIRIEVPDTVQ